METENAKEFKEVAHELVGWDKRIIRTIRDLTIRPGLAIQGSLSEPEKYISAWVYFFSIEALGFYIMSFGFSQDAIKTSARGYETLFAQLDINWHAKNIDQVIPFLSSEIGYKLFIPFLMIFRWLFFKSLIPSFKSNCFFLLYMAATIDLLALLPIVFWYTRQSDAIFTTLTSIISVASLTYFVWGTMQFYRIKFGVAFLRTVMLYATMFIFKFSILILVAVIIDRFM